MRKPDGRLRSVSVYTDLVRYWDLFRDLFRRDLRIRYRGSVLGVAWSLVNPLVLMGVYTLLFGVLLPVPANSGIKHFALFVLTGLVVWVFFQASVQTATGSLVGHASLVKQVRFPRQLLPFSVVATNLVTLAAMLVVVLPFALWLIPDTRETFWAAAFPLVALVGIVSGLAVILACANALFRDVEHLVAAILLPLFLLTPIFYSWGSLPGLSSHPFVADLVYYGNPLVPTVEAVRDPLFFGDMPGAGALLYVFAVAAGCLAVATYVFRRVDDRLVAEL
jgi:ABC-type polysaccharide/polyol phosphate export permease